MNAHQRRKFAAWKHSRLPLGHAVTVKGVGFAKIFKHDCGHPNLCIVKFSDDSFQWVTLHSVKPVVGVKVRPWWRSLHEKIRKGAR